MTVLCNTLPSLARPVRVPGFHSMKGLGVILLPPGLDSSHLQYSSPPSAQHFIKADNWLVPIYILGWEEALWNLSIFPRTQHSDLARSQTQSSQPRIHFANNQTIGSLPVFRINYKYNSYLSVSGITDFSAVKVRAQNCLWLFYIFLYIFFITDNLSNTSSGGKSVTSFYGSQNLTQSPSEWLVI